MTVSGSGGGARREVRLLVRWETVRDARRVAAGGGVTLLDEGEEEDDDEEE